MRTKNVLERLESVAKNCKRPSTTFHLVGMFILMSQMGFAQFIGRDGEGTYLDRWTVNDDNSHHCSYLRLQAFTDHGWNMVNERDLWWGYANNRNHEDRGIRLMTLTRSGNLGIGTTSPGEKLHVDGNIRAGSPGSNKIYYRFLEAPESNLHLDAASENDIFLGHYNKNNIRFGSSGNWMIVKNNGNVGIGTINPSERLQVAGNIAVENSGAIEVGHGLSEKEVNAGKIAYQKFSEGLDIVGAGTTNTNRKITFFAEGGSNFTGSVGIGTTNPGTYYKLIVEGKIGARGVDVKLGEWADFVFEEDYALRPLEEVEKFIRQNNHLPEIPSEKEVLEKGVDVGEMLRLQMQKIEELTLYVLQQQREIEALKRKQ